MWIVLAGVAGCGADASVSTRELADTLVAAFAPDTTRSRQITDGVWYHYVWSPRGPFAIHLAEVDLSKCELSLDVTSTRLSEGGASHERVSDLAARHSRPAIVAVNGDFFTPEGAPLGPEVARGRILKERQRPALAWRDGEGVIGTLGVADATVTGPQWPTGPGRIEVDVIGGFPELLDGGDPVGDLGVGSNPSFAASRHPRTAVGLDPEGERLWLVVVDGRQGEYSTGMSLPELTELLQGLGVRDALNLDGGGSSTMFVGGESVGRPSDAGGARPVVNALLVVSDSAQCR